MTQYVCVFQIAPIINGTISWQQCRVLVTVTGSERPFAALAKLPQGGRDEKGRYTWEGEVIMNGIWAERIYGTSEIVIRVGVAVGAFILFCYLLTELA